MVATSGTTHFGTIDDIAAAAIEAGVDALIVSNTTVAPFDNPKVRKALNMAINKQAIVDSFWNGLGVSDASFLPPALGWANNKSVPDDYRFDPKGAKALLAEAGYRGQPIRMVTNRRYPNVYDASVAAQAMAQCDVLVPAVTDTIDAVESWIAGQSFWVQIPILLATLLPIDYASSVGAELADSAVVIADDQGESGIYCEPLPGQSLTLGKITVTSGSTVKVRPV